MTNSFLDLWAKAEVDILGNKEPLSSRFPYRLGQMSCYQPRHGVHLGQDDGLSCRCPHWRRVQAWWLKGPGYTAGGQVLRPGRLAAVTG
jgi:hypothetical protein